MNTISIPLPLLTPILRAARRGLTRCDAGFSRRPDGLELLVQPRRDGGSAPYVLVTLRDDLTPAATLPPDCIGRLVLGRQGRRGAAAGVMRVGTELVPIDRLCLIGPGMHQLLLDSADEDNPPGPHLVERWSRTCGALGDNVWERLTGLACGVVGVGRTGSAVAELLGRGLGVRRLVLLDRDLLEEHNLGEMIGAGREHLGRPKAEVLAQTLQAELAPRLTVRPVPRSITHVEAVAALQDCDVLFGCVDHDGARLATAALAVLFLKPHLDVGAGIHGTGRERQLGLDVRLCWPGERCLLCLGGLADPIAARRLLQSAPGERQAYNSRDWRQERAGSLRSLNGLAAALAVRLWEDAVAGRVRDSRWLRLECDADGRVTISQRTPPPVPACPLCRLLGQGEDGLVRAADYFAQT